MLRFIKSIFNKKKEINPVFYFPEGFDLSAGFNKVKKLDFNDWEVDPKLNYIFLVVDDKQRVR